MKKKCSACKTLKVLDEFHNAKKGLHKKQANCKQCSKQITVKHKQKYREHYNKVARENSTTLSYRFTANKRRAKVRGYDWDLTKEQFNNLATKKCFYCDGEMGDKVKVGSGLDRVDNNIGYAEANCVSCCTICNKIKNNYLTKDETKFAINAILSYRRNNVANRNFNDSQALEKAIKSLHLDVAIGASGAPTLTKGLGITSIARNSAGDYTITLDDKFTRLMSVSMENLSSSAEDLSFQLKSEDVSGAKTIGFFTRVAAVATDPSNGARLLINIDVKNSSSGE